MYLSLCTALETVKQSTEQCSLYPSMDPFNLESIICNFQILNFMLTNIHIFSHTSTDCSEPLVVLIRILALITL